MGIFGRHGSAFSPLPRLWEPDPMVERVLPPLRRRKVVNHDDDDGDDANVDADADRGEHRNVMVWDPSSGSGRDVALLAEELEHHVRRQRERRNRNEEIASYDTGRRIRWPSWQSVESTGKWSLRASGGPRGRETV